MEGIMSNMSLKWSGQTLALVSAKGRVLLEGMVMLTHDHTRFTAIVRVAGGTSEQYFKLIRPHSADSALCGSAFGSDYMQRPMSRCHNGVAIMGWPVEEVVRGRTKYSLLKTALKRCFYEGKVFSSYRVAHWFLSELLCNGIGKAARLQGLARAFQKELEQ
jgi:hypothetical protein